MFDFRKLSGLLACILLIALACAPMFAQGSPEGRIVGVVKDAAGAVVPGAAVIIINDGTGKTYNATSSGEGTFTMPSLSAGIYTVQVTAKGFAKASYTQVKIEPGKDYSLIANLQIGAATETVEVQAGQELVNTSSSEVSSTVTVNQVKNLPLLGRDIIGLVSTQAGSAYTGRTATSLNGARPSWSQVTLDGINIQDPYIRTNALDYIPNRPTTDTVSEFTVSGSGQGADASLGANGVRMVTPSGTNAYHGSVWDYNRNAALEANDWWNNHYGVDRPGRNRNEFGGRLGGPVIKNKLFFYGYYVGIRDRVTAQRERTIPLNNDYLTGIFRYPKNDGTIGSVNVLTAVTGYNLGIDPKIQSSFLSKVIAASNVNDRTAGDKFNTGGFIENVNDNYNRDNYGWRIDFEANKNHHFDGTYSHMHEVTMRPEYDPVTPGGGATPLVSNDSSPKLYSVGWRWNVNNSLINNFRTGGNIVNAPFKVDYKNTDGFRYANGASTSWQALASGIAVADTQVYFMNQGRDPKVFQYNDDLSWVKGNHFFNFGASYQRQRIYTYNDEGTLPTFTFGWSTLAPSAAQIKLASQLPDVKTTESSTWLSRANALRGFLAGIISGYSQTFQVANKTSGFVNGQRQERNLSLDDISMYVQDKWRIRPNMTLSYGVKWEYMSPYKEKNGLQLGPVYTDPNDPIASLMDPNGQVSFMEQAFNKVWTNFGPTVGFAWDPFKNGKTSIRGGYTLTFVNDDQYRFAGNAADGNAGLNATATSTRQYTSLTAGTLLPGGVTSMGMPVVPTPAFTMPRTYADQLALSSTNVVWALNPNVASPMIHEINFGIERELPYNMGLSVRYVGTLARDLLRGVDLNQNKAGNDADYLADFKRARNNGYLAQAAGLGFDARYNSTIAGSQPLTFFNGGDFATYINYPTVSTYLQQNQAGSLADWYVYNQFTDAAQRFLPNPGIYAVDYGYNGAQSSYHSFQVELKRRFTNGLQFQTNYVWSKLLSTSPTGDSGQTRFDPLLDNARPQLAKARADYDLRHAIKANAVYDLPFGRGKKFFGGANGVLDRVVGGWQLSQIFTWQSGNPWSILSTRGTFNRGARSATQTAVSTLTQEQIKATFGVRMLPDGRVFYIDPNLVNPTTGTGAGGDNQNNTATFANQVFFNPTAGNIGNLGVLAFDGPRYFNIDLGLGKTTKITERVNTTIRADFFNVTNTPSFYIGDREINSSSFGTITSTLSSARIIQISLRLEF